MKKIMIKIGIFFIIILLFLVILLECSQGLMPFGLFFVSLLVFVSGALSRFLIGTFKYQRLLQVCKVLLFTGLISLALSYMIIRIQSIVSSKNANLLITGIEAFKKDQGIYPDSLESLMPQYFKNLPKAWIGIIPKDFLYESANTLGHRSKYDYKLKNVESYFLVGYCEYIGVENFYYSNEKIWHHDD